MVDEITIDELDKHFRSLTNPATREVGAGRFKSFLTTQGVHHTDSHKYVNNLHKYINACEPSKKKHYVSELGRCEANNEILRQLLTGWAMRKLFQPRLRPLRGKTPVFAAPVNGLIH